MVARNERIDLRIWNAAMTGWWPLADYTDLTLEGREDWEVTQGSFTIPADHPLAPRVRSARHIPVPVSFELNGVCWDGMIESVETGKKSDGEQCVQAHMLSDHKHFGRMLGRGPIVSATDDSSEVEKGRIGDITARLVSRGAVRTGLPVYVLIDDAGDYTEIEVRTEDYIRELLADPLAGSNSFVQVRKLRPGQPLPGVGKLLHYAGVMERQWEQAQLDAGMWPNATTSPRIEGAALTDDTPVLPDNSWGGEGLVDFEGAVLTEPLRGVCWIPFETVVERPLGYFADVDPELVHVATREQIKAGAGAINGRPHYVTFFKAGSLSATTAPKLGQCAEAGLLRTLAGDTLTEDQAYSHIGSGAAYAWKNGATWILATQAEFEQDSQKYIPRGDQQKQTPGILVWQHAGRDRRGIVFSSSPGGGLQAWATTETAPDGAMLIGGGQMDAQTIAALESGVLTPSGTVANVDESTASAVLPSGSGLPGAVEQLDVDVQPNATISGTGVSFSKAGGRVDIAQAGPFFLREKYINLGGSGGANPVSEIAREWAKSQGSTSMSFTPGNHKSVVFGDDVTLPNGRVVPGWKPGDRVSFVDGNTRVSEVIMGFSLKASPQEPLTVEPIMGRVVNGVLANLQQRLEKSENTSKKAILAPDQKVPKEEVKAIADDSASVVNKSLIEVSKDLSERISKTVVDADFAEYDAELQASLWGDQGEFNRINTKFQEKQKAIDAAQDQINRLQDERLADQDEAIEAIRAQQAAEVEASKRRPNVALVSKYGSSHPDAKSNPSYSGKYAVVMSKNMKGNATHIELFSFDDSQWGRPLSRIREEYYPAGFDNTFVDDINANEMMKITWADALIVSKSSKKYADSTTPAQSVWTTVEAHTISPAKEARVFAATWTARWNAVNRGSMYRARIITSAGTALAEWGSSNIGPFTSLGDGRYTMGISCQNKTIPAGQTVLFQVYSNAGGSSQRAISSSDSNATWIEDV